MPHLRLILSDLHLGTGSRRGELNAFEDFTHDERFAELLEHYREKGKGSEVELILNGDIFDLLKIKIGGVWPIEITPAIATEKLKKCLEGHPRFVRAIREFLEDPNNRLTYLPGNHDLDMWFPEPQKLFKRYVAPGEIAELVQFVTTSDTYYLPEGIQIRHGHQLERIHRVDYSHITRTRRDGTEILDLPWGTLWVLEVMNPAKEERNYVDRIQPLGRFMLGALLFDTRFALRFLFRSARYFAKHRVFTVRAWRERIRRIPKLLKEELIALDGYDEAALKSLLKMRGVSTLIVGHSHGPRYKAVGDKLLVNTGTWMQMVNLDIQYLGRDSGLTYALIEYDERGKPHTSLMRWRGPIPLNETIAYAD